MTDRFRLHNAVMLVNCILRSVRFVEQSLVDRIAIGDVALSSVVTVHIDGCKLDSSSDLSSNNTDNIILSSIPFDCMVFPSRAIGRRFLEYLVSNLMCGCARRNEPFVM